MPISEKPRFKFRCRSLLLAVLFLAVAIGWYGNRMRNIRRQEALIDSIAERGGYVWLDVAGPFIDIDFAPSQIGRSCGQVHCLAGPNEPSGMFADTDMALLEQLDDLRSVCFANTEVSEDAIETFRQLRPGVELVVRPSPP